MIKQKAIATLCDLPIALHDIELIHTETVFVEVAKTSMFKFVKMKSHKK